MSSGSKVIEEWKPDIIYSSANPFTSLLVAKRLSQKYSIPFVAEFRDLWSDNPYIELPWWRQKIDLKLESSVLNSTKACVTVSEPLKQKLAEKFSPVKLK